MRWLSTGLSGQEKFLPLVAVVAAAVALAAPVHADVDTDFANQLHGYGIYGQRDYNAWLGKITCNRLGYGVDADAYKSAAFLSKNLPRNSTTAQTWQFMNAAINNYCPDQMPVLIGCRAPPMMLRPGCRRGTAAALKRQERPLNTPRSVHRVPARSVLRAATTVVAGGIAC